LYIPFGWSHVKIERVAGQTKISGDDVGAKTLKEIVKRPLIKGMYGAVHS